MLHGQTQKRQNVPGRVLPSKAAGGLGVAGRLPRVEVLGSTSGLSSPGALSLPRAGNLQSHACASCPQTLALTAFQGKTFPNICTHVPFGVFRRLQIILVREQLLYKDASNNLVIEKHIIFVLKEKNRFFQR